MSRGAWARTLAAWLAIGVCGSVLALTWFGSNAIREWQGSEARLASDRVRRTTDLLVKALARDMRGVQSSVLASPRWHDLTTDPTVEINALAASAFARYPYPESFFAWQHPSPSDTLTFFNRTERPPLWVPKAPTPQPFPVTVAAMPEVARVLMEHITADAATGARFATFETAVSGAPYQVVARLVYRDPRREQLDGVFGFTVSLDWVRRHYFQELVDQVTLPDNMSDEFSVRIVDEQGQLVAGPASAPEDAPRTEQGFPLAFFDPLILGLDPPRNLSPRQWMVRAQAHVDPALAGAIRGANRTLIIAALSAVVLAMGLVLTARATRARARLAEMRSDFVASVTHELKTPLASIRALADTLVSGRVAAPETQREYALLIAQEAKRQTRLVDNLLAFARITDVTEAYSFEAISTPELVDGVVDRFRSQLVERSFHVTVDVRDDVPAIHADRVAMELLLDNLIDNAIRYSTDDRHIAISAEHDDAKVRIRIADHGIGIPPEELPHVIKRFYRGRGVQVNGSGLGLAIANRIVADHGGALTIDSVVQSGTVVTMWLPTVRQGYEETDSGRRG